jgi:transketolase
MNTKNKIIKKILYTSSKNKEGHIGSSLSILDILFVIYEKFIPNKDTKFILSKGHASLGLYCVMEHFGLLKEDLENFCKFDSLLGGHPTIALEGVECSTGSLGHGMPFALGIALSKKIKHQTGKVITLIGDGEANEGTIWETALLASHHKLNNFYCILDYNHSTDRAVDISNIKDKFNSFGWHCIEIDGHSQNDIYNAISYNHSQKPIFILANTIKGKGCKTMENNPEWHHKYPSYEEYENFIKELV